MTGASAAVGGETSTDSWQRISTPASTIGPWLPEGALGAQLAELPIPKALAAALNGTLDATAAAEQAQADLETIARSVN